MIHIPRRRVLLLLGATLFVSACGGRRKERRRSRRSNRSGKEPPLYPNETRKLRRLINKYADLYDVPRPLVHKVIIRESTHRPGARNGPYYGLMQILPATAKTMGYRGEPKGLLDAETNLKYAVKYLRGAWLLSNGSYDTAVKWYSRGYYYEAKRRGMLKETGLRP
jgi:soluble lytic murein transglycosylase-like protein